MLAFVASSQPSLNYAWTFPLHFLTQGSAHSYKAGIKKTFFISSALSPLAWAGEKLSRILHVEPLHFPNLVMETWLGPFLPIAFCYVSLYCEADTMRVWEKTAGCWESLKLKQFSDGWNRYSILSFIFPVKNKAKLRLVSASIEVFH